MSTTNLGNQRIVFDYKYPLKGTDFNFAFKDIIPTGIYKGGELTCDLVSQTITFHPFVAVLDSDTQKTVRVETTTAFTLDADSTKPVIYAAYLYIEAEENYADIGFTTTDTSVTNEVVLGRAIFSGTTLTGVDYTGRDMGLFYSGTMYLPNGGIETSGDLHTNSDLIVGGTASITGNLSASIITSDSIALKAVKGLISGGGVYYTSNSGVCGAEPGVYEVYDGTIVELTSRTPATLGSHTKETWAYVALSKTGVVALIQASIWTEHLIGDGAGGSYTGAVADSNTYKFTPSPYDLILANHNSGEAIFDFTKNGYYPVALYTQYRIIGAVWKNSSGNYIYGVSYKSGRNKNDNVLEGVGPTGGTEENYLDADSAHTLVNVGLGGNSVYGFTISHFHKIWGNDYKLLDMSSYAHRILSLRTGLKTSIHYKIVVPQQGASARTTVEVIRVRPDSITEVLCKQANEGYESINHDFPLNLVLSNNEHLSILNSVNNNNYVIRVFPPHAMFEVIS